MVPDLQLPRGLHTHTHVPTHMLPCIHTCTYTHSHESGTMKKHKEESVVLYPCSTGIVMYMYSEVRVVRESIS